MLAFRSFFRVVVGLALEGHSVALSKVEGHVDPNLQGFEKVPNRGSCFSMFILGAVENNIYLVLSFLRKLVVLSSFAV